LLAEYQTEFFSLDPLDNRGKKRPTKKPKCPWAVTGQRNCAYLHIKALDHQVFLTLGVGLIAFQGIVGDHYSVAIALLLYNTIPPTLTLHLDEGSPAYSMTWYLLHKEELRMLAARDPYHREWNDIKLGTSRAKMWHVVLLMTVVFNLPFGPWDGATWFSKIKTMAEEMVKSLTASNPLFIALYEVLCIDFGVEPVGTAEHRQLVFERMFTSEAFAVKGVKVSLRRWFGWFDAAHHYLPMWHARLMALIAIGQSIGVYKTLRDVPLWCHATKPELGEEDGGEGGESEGEHSDADAAVPNAAEVAAAAAAAAAVASNAQAQEDTGPTKTKDARSELAALRKSLKNSLFVAAAILSKDYIRFFVVMLLEVCRPIYTRHSHNTRTCREPSNVVQFYLFAASMDYMATVSECASVFMNMPLLQSMGFITDFGRGLPPKLTVVSELVQAQTSNAFYMLDLFCGVAFHRITSMMWHSHCWPGLLANLASNNDEVFDATATQLVRDFRIYLDIVDQGKSCNTFTMKLIKGSPFKLRIVFEITITLLAPLCSIGWESKRTAVRKYVQLLFSGWGQTKICEDAFKHLRERESMDTLTGVKGTMSYYANLVNMGAITLHHRQDITPAVDELYATGKPSEMFVSKHHSPTLTNAMDITKTATWPTYSAQSSKKTYADIVLLRYLKANNCFASASKCWQCELFQPNSVIHQTATKTFVLVLGQLCFQVLVCWRIEDVRVNGTNYMAYILGGDVVVNSEPALLCITDVKQYSVVPTQAISPLNY